MALSRGPWLLAPKRKQLMEIINSSEHPLSAQQVRSCLPGLLLMDIINLQSAVFSHV